MLRIIFTKYRFAKEWQDHPPSAEIFPNTSPTPTTFIETLYILYARQYDAERWGDKTPIYSSYVNLLDTMFPNAQFIHLIRDGRDVGLSMIDKWSKREIHIDIYFAARNWVRRTRQAITGRYLGAERYYELRYEDLVADPEKELRSICKFLGKPYVPEMAQPERLGRERIEPGSFHDPIRYPPSTQRVACWQREMSPTDQRLFQHIAGDLLQELGYQLEDLGTMSFKERIHMLALSIKYYTLRAGRRILQGLGMMPPI